MGNRKVLLIVVIAVVVLAVGAVVATFLGVLRQRIKCLRTDIALYRLSMLLILEG